MIYIWWDTERENLSWSLLGVKGLSPCGVIYIYHKKSNCQNVETKLVSLIPELCAKGHPGDMAYSTFQKHERFTSRPLSTQGLLVWWKNLFVFKQYNGDQNWRKQLTRGEEEEEKPKQLRNILFSCLWYQTLSARVEDWLLLSTSRPVLRAACACNFSPALHNHRLLLVLFCLFFLFPLYVNYVFRLFCFLVNFL